MNWHTEDIEQVLKAVESSRKGLSAGAVQERQDRYGPNELEEKKKKTAWQLFFAQFTDFMILVLVAAAIISGVVGDVTDTIIILIIVLLNAVVGFIQEYRAEKAMEALKKMATSHTTVLRDGHPEKMTITELVPGDVVLLEAGEVVPADLRLFEVHALRIEESSLTGESVPADKHTAPLQQADLPPGDRINMAFKGTQVINGRGTGVVIGTGMNTEIGAIARMLQEKEGLTPLQKRMNDFGKKLSYGVLIICLVLFGIGWLRGEDPINMLLVAISLAVAAIPEALPALITIALARGAARLVKQQVLIRKLPAVETLGSITYICSDKTGTLTQNKMRVVKVEPAADNDENKENDEKDDLSWLDYSLSLNHDVKITSSGLKGDPTEIALVEYFQQNKQAGLEAILEQYPRVEEVPFDSDRKIMTTVHEYREQFLVVSKGAVESLLNALDHQDNSEAILQQAEAMAKEGMRVLAFGYKIIHELPASIDTQLETALTFAGLAGMIDPPREEVKTAIRECKTAGIHPVMITGDHPATAAAIAREIGILTANDLVITGQELSQLSPEAFAEKVELIRVYARVSPEQKLTIVKTLQQKKQYVAMTGDGVNDAPSLKMANIGIAMGITGTDVSKEASHMILLDDNFATIVRAVKEGRRIYDNIRKFVKYIMTCNSAEIITIFVAPLIGLPIPLLPIHILWINLVTDGLPGLALSAEQAEKNIMQRPPRPTNENLLAGGTGTHIIWVGLLMAGITLGMQAWALETASTHWQTMVFTVLSFAQLGHVLAISSESEFIFRKGFFSNTALIGAIIFTTLLQLGVIYIPFANEIFKTEPLTLKELLISLSAAALIFVAVEIEKIFRRRKQPSLVAQ